MNNQKVIIMGAAGRDFHNFNLYFRQNQAYQVIAFTATQIPNIEGRLYPPELAGPLYPQGIPIRPESELVSLIQTHRIDEVIFAYSDVSHEYVMHRASEVLAAGADFRLLGPRHTWLQSSKPVVAICAVRTGSGKSQTTRRVCELLQGQEKKVVAVRHPMPYGNLVVQAVQRFADYDDLDEYECTIEEREEYEPHLERGIVVYAGVDYEAILRRAEAEADVVIWDGGNNDLPFFRPDLHLVVVDPHRPGHELKYHPGEANLRMADVVVINKIDTADADNIIEVRRNIQAVAPQAVVVDAASPLTVADPAAIRGRRVLAIEDGPTLTHGEMAYGAAVMAARRFGAAEVIDPRPYAVGSLVETYRKYSSTGPLLPAMGYGPAQIQELQATINATPCDLVLIGTPINLGRLINIQHPWQQVRYDLQEIGHPTLAEILSERLKLKSKT
jgi:predicted GTPase